ncbi:uncharacterized protein NP_5290A [Natronomonas pharaonis DSM 2160]|uniref:Uncharacterized protein n=1 Tax=Natronomonas pharaonis (strain ATCC 35678 / DSM 2160 / CIP 103997 / JCM 8858 / NBRC 14720 / NCIMB 2260 / Gabara) TaxID=348780 RepID=A0A1U7EZI3_NATPD|nr:hypothetical protein [Natronomonas pharaonis]CAI50736.1 uncharacterized protein NP_5290A [Natronomonas pharaonis DSM 2160]
MSEPNSTYGKAGVGVLLLAAVVWSAAVVLAESGAAPDATTQGIGYVGLALLAVGMVAHVLLILSAYGPDDLE